jgi:glycosyltransferase involved in cell wall biosynthesis
MSAVAYERDPQRSAIRPAEAIASGVPLRVLTLTTLYPNEANPRHGIFVETRLRELCASAPIDLQVVAPVPWFPFRWSIAGRYALFAAAPRFETRNGVPVRHPRFLTIPHIGMALQPTSLAMASMLAARELLNEGWSCDVIDAHYLYPDGVAAALLARRLRRPFVVTARGTDVNVIARMPGPRRRILAALCEAASVIAVSESLKQALVELGVPAASVEVLRNGVDANLFAPVPGELARTRLGVATGTHLIVSVGNLVPEKGHDLVLRAARQIEGAHVMVVGRGPELPRLRALTQQIGMEQRVRFIDNVPQDELPSIYSAANVLALGSLREGWPNVLLEAMACGTPVVATGVGGVREIITNTIAGEVVAERDERIFAAALERVLSRRPDRAAVRAHAAVFAWAPIVRRYREILAAARGNSEHHA